MDILRRVQQLYRQGRRLEQNWVQSTDSAREEFLTLLRSKHLDNPEWSFLNTIGSRTAKLAQRELVNILSSIERRLEIALADHEFELNAIDENAVQKQWPLVIVLDQIRSAFNVGAIFRNADCLGVRKVILCGYTMTPDSDRLKKTAMGTSEWVAWEYIESVDQAIEQLRQDGYVVYGVETGAQSISVLAFEPEEKSALVFGNEKYGIKPSTLQMCDAIVRIPTFGRKNSLNIANAMCVAGYRYIQVNM